MADNGLLKSGQMDLIELAVSEVESDIYLVVGVARMNEFEIGEKN